MAWQWVRLDETATEERVVRQFHEYWVRGGMCRQANVLPDLDASVVYGDELLEELLRFEPAGSSRLYRAVAKHRRGELLALPLVLVEAEPAGEETLPRLERLVVGPQAL